MKASFLLKDLNETRLIKKYFGRNAKERRALEKEKLGC